MQTIVISRPSVTQPLVRGRTGSHPPRRSLLLVVLASLVYLLFAQAASAEQVSYQQITPVGFYDAVPALPGGGILGLSGDADDVSADGSSVIFSTFGPFPGIPDTGGRLDIFRASRGAGGTWSTSWMSPGPSTQFDDNQSDRFFEAANTDGSKILYVSRAQNDPSRVDCGEPELGGVQEFCYARLYEYDSTTGRTTLVSRASEQPEALFDSHFAGASPELGTVAWLSEEAMAPGVEDHNSEDVYSSGEGGQAMLVSAVSGSTGSVASAQLAVAPIEGGYEFEQVGFADSLQIPGRNAYIVSADGSEVFFQDVRQLAAGAPGPNIQNVYMRRGNITTLVSSPAQRTLPTTVTPSVSFFDDATPDGSSVFFNTASQLTNGDGNESFDVYRYDVPTGQVSLVSAVGGSETAASEGPGSGSYFAAVSADGSHVYFVSRDDLDPGSAPPGEAWKLYERAEGQTRFIAVFPEGAELEDTRPENPTVGFEADDIQSTCEDNISVVEGNEIGETVDKGGCEAIATMRATADGSRLIFESAQPLTPGAASGLQCVTAARPSIPGDGALTGGEPGQGCNIYLYEDATQTIRLLSPGTSTYGAFLTRAPEQVTFGAKQESSNPLYQPLLMSEDGSRVFFSSKDALVPGAVAGLRNIYAWLEGSLTLVSPPEETSEAIYDGNSADGSQVFFHTRQSLVPGVENHQQFAIYDAKLGEAPQNGETDPSTAGQPIASAPPQALSVASATVSTLPPVTVSGSSTKQAVAPAERPKVLTKTERLTQALRACRTSHTKQRRTCEARAAKAYGSKPASKTKQKPHTGKRGGR